MEEATDPRLVQQISECLREKTTEELTAIVHTRDRSRWSDEAFEAIDRILRDREREANRVRDLEKRRDVDGLVAAACDPQDPGLPVNRAGAALAAMKTPAAVDKLLAVALDRSADRLRRGNAIQALGEIADPRAATLLETLLRGRSGFLRARTAQALRKLHTAEADKAVDEYERVEATKARARWAWFPECDRVPFMLGSIAWGLVLPRLLLLGHGDLHQDGGLVFSMLLTSLGFTSVMIGSFRRNGTLSLLRLPGLSVIVALLLLVAWFFGVLQEDERLWGAVKTGYTAWIGGYLAIFLRRLASGLLGIDYFRREDA
jgi:hypothetical protein